MGHYQPHSTSAANGLERIGHDEDVVGVTQGHAWEERSRKDN